MPGPGRKPATEADVENAAFAALQAVDEGEREIGQRAHVEIDHGELLGAVERARGADQTEARIVDHGLRLEITRRQCRGDVVRRARAARRPPAERSGVAAGGDGVGHRASACSRRATRPVRWPLAANRARAPARCPADAPVQLGVIPERGSGDQRDRSRLVAVCVVLARRRAGRARSARATKRREIRGAPDQVALELADVAVGVDDLPHHLDHAAGDRPPRASG